MEMLSLDACICSSRAFESLCVSWVLLCMFVCQSYVIYLLKQKSAHLRKWRRDVTLGSGRMARQCPMSISNPQPPIKKLRSYFPFFNRKSYENFASSIGFPKSPKTVVEMSMKNLVAKTNKKNDFSRDLSPLSELVTYAHYQKTCLIKWSFVMSSKGWDSAHTCISECLWFYL